MEEEIDVSEEEDVVVTEVALTLNDAHIRHFHSPFHSHFDGIGSVQKYIMVVDTVQEMLSGTD